MYSLLLKDFLLSRKAFLMAVGYAVFISIVFQNEVLASTANIMGAMAISYFFVLWVCAYEDKNNVEIFLNSLPLARVEIVRSRYLSVILSFFAAIIIMSVVGLILKSVGLPFPRYYMKPLDILIAFTCTVVIFSLYLPIYYKLGYLKSKAFNLIIFLVIFFTPSLLADLVKKRYSLNTIEQAVAFFNKQPSWLLTLLVVAVLLVLLYISYLLSVTFYRRREF